jgi:hypothetical protein
LVQRISGLQEKQELLTLAAVRDLLPVALSWNLVRAASIPLVHAQAGVAYLLLLLQSVFVVIGASLVGAVHVIISGGIRSSTLRVGLPGVAFAGGLLPRLTVPNVVIAREAGVA